MTRTKFLKLLLTSIGTLSAYPVLPQAYANKKEVLIIGAGIAGLAAARKLVGAGFQVTILEARNRVGGRIWTDSSMGIPVEMGASLIEGYKGNPLAKVVEQLKLHTVSFNLEESEIYNAKGEKISEEEELKLEGYFKDFLAKIDSQKDSASKKDSLEIAKQNFLSDLSLSEFEKNALDCIIASEIEMKYGTNLKNLSVKYHDETDSLSGGDVVLSSGLSDFTAFLAKGLNIKLSHQVSKIEYDKKIKIHTNQGEFTSDYAIVTVPLGVLKKKKIQFIPELPDKKQSAIQNLGFGIVNKVFLKFPKKFWSSETSRFGLVTASASNRVEFQDLNPIKNTPMLSAIVSGENAISLEKTNKKEIIKDLTDILKKIYGNKNPSPLEVSHSRWYTDPFSFGTGAYSSVTSEPNDFKTLSESVDDILFFAGEATDDRYPSRVHGAYLSGDREADKIINLSEI